MAAIPNEKLKTLINTEIGIAWLTETCSASSRKYVTTSSCAKICEEKVYVQKSFANKITNAGSRIAILILINNDEWITADASAKKPNIHM